MTATAPHGEEADGELTRSGRLRHGGPLSLALAATVVPALPPFLTGGLGVQIHHALGLSSRELGAVVSAYFGVAAVSSAALGHVGQRLGTQRSLLAAALICGTSVLGMAVWAHSFASLLACLAVGGMGNALTQPAVNDFLARGIGAPRLGTALGIKQSAIPIAVLISGASIPALALTVGWRGVFGAAAASIAAFALILLRLAPIPTPVAPVEARSRTARRALVVLAGAAGLASMGGNALGTFLVSAAVANGMGQGNAGLLLAAGSALCAVVRVGGGVWVDRTGMEPLALVVALMVAGSVGFLALSSSQTWLLVGGAPLAFAGGWGWAGLFQLVVVTRNPGAPAIATGITQTGVYAGAATGPVVFGLIAESSYAAAWTSTAVVMIVAALLALSAWRSIEWLPASASTAEHPRP